MAAETCVVCKATSDQKLGHWTFNGYTWRCPECANARFIPGAVFPFTTRHFDGTPITVENTRQLRKLEAQHGVHHAAMNLDARSLEHYEHGR